MIKVTVRVGGYSESIATQRALVAAKDVQAATESANESASSANTAADKANTEAEEANNAAKNARYETANSIAQTNKCKEVTEEAKEAALDAQRASIDARTNASYAEQAVEDVQAAIASQSLGIPSSMTVEYPQHLTLGNKENNKIVATLYPLATALQNVLFLSDNNAVSVYPDGSIHINKAGRSVVHVVPTMNTALYRTLLITVSEPSVRLTKTNSVRLLAGGTFRLN